MNGSSNDGALSSTIPVFTPEQRVLQQAAQQAEEDAATADEKELERERRRLTASIVSRNIRFTRSPPTHTDDETNANTAFRPRQLAVLFISRSGILAVIAKAIIARSHARDVTAHAAAYEYEQRMSNGSQETSSAVTLSPRTVQSIAETFALNIDSTVASLDAYSTRTVDFICAMTPLPDSSSERVTLPPHQHLITAPFVERDDRDNAALYSADEFDRIKQYVDGIPELISQLI